MNVVTLIGNLATEVSLREVGQEKKVASFVLAVARTGRDGGADYVTVSAWDRQGELCAEYLGKGRRIAVDGRQVSVLGGGRQAAERDRGGCEADRVPRRWTAARRGDRGGG